MEITFTLPTHLEKIAMAQARSRDMRIESLCKELLELALVEVGLPFKLVPSRAELETWLGNRPDENRIRYDSFSNDED